VRQKGDDHEHELFWFVGAVERGALGGAEGARTSFALVAALFLAVDHYVPFTFASASAAVFVATELLGRVHVVFSTPADFMAISKGVAEPAFFQLLSTVARGASTFR
jgi:hypothetical protein